MGLFKKVLHKKDIPDELPDLAVEELKKDLKQVSNPSQENKVEQTTNSDSAGTEKTAPQQPEAVTEAQSETTTEQQPEATTQETSGEEQTTAPETEENTETQQQAGTEATTIQKPDNAQDTSTKENSYFNDILDNLNEDTRIIHAMKELHEKPDLVREMKQYWDKKHDTLILKALKRDLKSKIEEKTVALKKLEHEWREAQALIIEKEEMMRKEERELKSIINEFLKILQHNKKETHREQENKVLKKRRPKKGNDAK